jgi:hypothetical protein
MLVGAAFWLAACSGFIDAPLPNRPAFGISLGSLDKRAPDASRIFLPARARDGSATAAHAIAALLNFASAATGITALAKG